MTQRQQVDCGTGQAVPVPLTAAEQADFDARVAAAAAAAPGIAAAAANAATLNGNMRSALVRLRQIQSANPATVTLPQVAQAVIDLATDVLYIARILSQQYDGTT